MRRPGAPWSPGSGAFYSEENARPTVGVIDGQRRAPAAIMGVRGPGAVAAPPTVSGLGRVRPPLGPHLGAANPALVAGRVAPEGAPLGENSKRPIRSGLPTPNLSFVHVIHMTTFSPPRRP